MTYHAPPIVKLAEQLLLEIERAVQRFSRFHRYASGTALRQQIRSVLRLAQCAYSEPENRSVHVAELVRELDMLQSELQLAAQLHAFTSKAKFEQLARIRRELGKQAGGWKKDVHRSAQNGQPTYRRGQRGEKLSTAVASSIGANV